MLLNSTFFVPTIFSCMPRALLGGWVGMGRRSLRAAPARTATTLRSSSLSLLGGKRIYAKPLSVRDAFSFYYQPSA